MSSPFKVLKLNEQFMVWLRIYPHPISDITDADNDFFKSITTYCISFNDLAFITTSSVFVYQNASNIMVALRTTMVIIGTSQAFGMFLYVGCKIDKVKMLQIKLQEIIDKTALGKILRRILHSSVKKIVY